MKTWVSLAIGATALSFQVAVLYPWHEAISYELSDMNRQIQRLREDCQTKRN